MYQLIDETQVRRLDDGAIIPNSDENLDWREYQKWLSVGNVAAPAKKQSPSVPSVVSAFQARAALFAAGLLPKIEALMANSATPELAKLAWTHAVEFRRSSPTVAEIALQLKITDDQLDALFVEAASIKA